MKRNNFVLLLAIISPCFAKIDVALGLKTSRFFIENGFYYERVDSVPMAFNVDWEYERYFGLSAELLITFIKNFGLRLELIEYKKFDNNEPFKNRGCGGSGLALFSNLDADLIYILPFWYRVSPLFYGGMNLENFYGKPYNDMRAHGATYEYRIGVGLNYRYNRNINIFSEIQTFTCFQYTKRLPLVDATYTDYYYLLGLGRINLGCRIRL